MKSDADHHEQHVESEERIECLSFTKAQERALVRKYDLRLLPFLSFMYLFSSLDRSSVGKVTSYIFISHQRRYLNFLCCHHIIGNAVLDNFEQDLGMTGNQLNTAITIFYVTYWDQFHVA
jgi:hypothetical protein